MGRKLCANFSSLYLYSGPGSSGNMKCEFCGKVDFAYKFRRSKRFCSMACAKRYNVGCSRRMHLFTTSSGARYMRKKHSMSRMWKQSGGRMSSGPLQRVSRFIRLSRFGANRQKTTCTTLYGDTSSFEELSKRSRRRLNLHQSAQFLIGDYQRINLQA